MFSSNVELSSIPTPHAAVEVRTINNPYVGGDYGYQDNQNSGDMRQRGSCNKGKVVCVGVVGVLLSGMAVGVWALAGRMKEIGRIWGMVKPTGARLSALEDALWKSDCESDLARFKTFQNAEDQQACEAAFQNFATELTDCNDNTGDVSGLATEFMTEQPEGAEAGETFLNVACKYKDKVDAHTQLEHEANCFEKAFYLEGNLTSSLNIDECVGLNETMTNFINMTDDSCANPQMFLDAFDQCGVGSTTLKEELNAFAEPRRENSCFQEVCNVKDEVSDVQSVRTDYDGLDYFGYGVFYPLRFGSGSGTKYAPSATVMRQNGASSKVTGTTRYSGGRGGTAGIRSGSGKSSGSGGSGGG